ncbi:prepilin-type N-terminal cleavage/methylation domain-containing protein, partial [Patescibacteria group bacterium]|nr:prepilin-type N-terminal cleavage/methylation domain-containing protein [Patescibacteria group bacterium]
MRNRGFTLIELLVVIA